MSDYEVHMKYHYTLLQDCNGTAARINEYEFESYTQFSWSLVLPGQAVTYLSPSSSATHNPSTQDTPGRHQVMRGQGWAFMPLNDGNTRERKGRKWKEN